MRKKWIFVGISIFTIVLLIICLVKVRHPKGMKENAPGQQNSALQNAQQKPSSPKVTEIGAIEPLISVSVKSNVEGEIEALYVSEGDYVEKGQILLKIDDKQIREERNQADANLKAAEAQLEQSQRNILLTATLKEGELKQAQTAVDVAKARIKATKDTTIQMIIEAEMEIAKTRNALEQDKISIRQAEIAERQAQLARKQAQARLQSAEVELKNANAELQRIQKLYDKQFVSKQTSEDAQAKQAAASAQYEQAQQDIESHQETINLQQENILALKKVLDDRKMTLAFQERNLELLKEARAAIEAQVEAELESAKTHYQLQC